MRHGMASSQSKFCQDRNGIRWVLLEGMITRKTKQDDPAGGKNLPVDRVMSVEKTVVKRVNRSPLAWPAIYIACILLALTAWIFSLEVSALLAIPTLLAGLWFLFWGLARIKGTEEVLDAYQLITNGQKLSDWIIVGSHEEVLGFIEGIRNDMGGSKRAAAH
jgi:hypothetical protein